MPQPSSGAAPLHPLLFRGIFFTALATLLLELALIRILSFTIWHHFGYAMFSTALLGFGASGTFLAIRPQVGARDLPGSLARTALLAAASALGALRHYIRTAGERFDLIQLTGVDTLSAMNSGAYVLGENYLYTVEAFHDYLDALEPGGILSFAMGNFNPKRPRAAGRIVSVANRALRARGVERPQDHIAVVDSRSLYAEVLIRNTPFTRAESERLDEVSESLAFRPLWLPRIGGHPIFEQLASLEGDALGAFLDEQHFLLTPVEDDQPFFLSFFRWSDLLAPGALAPSHSTALGQIVVTVTLGSLLISLGIGSFLSKRWVGRERTALPGAVAILALLMAFYVFGMPPLQDAVLGASLFVRAATTIALLFPLGLVLGIFFPLGVREAARIHPDLVPWGWAVNGCASVTGGVLAIVLAMSFGFTTVWLVSLGIYCAGAAGFLWATRDRARGTT